MNVLHRIDNISDPVPVGEVSIRERKHSLLQSDHPLPAKPFKLPHYV